MSRTHPLRPRALSMAVAAALASPALFVSPQALAQASDPSLGRVEITGSNIRRAQAETAAPVQVITREDIDKSGKTSVAEYLQTLTADNQGSVPMTFGNGFATGASGLSLRGLGAASTLVLINGRRIAPYGLADDGQKVFANLNVIPLEAVERIEVLKDGASAIYGSDAIAGVVNVILRKNFQGTVAKASVGQSRYGDGTEKVASITHGSSNDAAGTSFLFSAEVRDVDSIYYANRMNRGAVGTQDLRFLGGSTVSPTIPGAIVGVNAASSSLVGNVRNPANSVYVSRSDPAAPGVTRTFPNANCANFTNIAQGDPGGGCIVDLARKYGQVQPDSQSLNLFGRFSKQLNASTELYGELNLYSSSARSQTTPSAISSSSGYPGGPVSNSAVALGAAHPDNPFFDSAARVRYLAGDVGPRVNSVDSTFARVLAGVKGTMGAWDYDSAFLHSETTVSNARSGYLQLDVANALLNPTAANVAKATANSAAYRALPAGTYWRIAENAGLNSAALYAALSPQISNNANASTTSLDFKASRELGKLEGGPIGLALGAEVRREAVRLDPTTGTDRGNIIGLGYSAYDGSRSVVAAYGEALFPVTKKLEINTALRADSYGGSIGTSVTPKIGFKFVPASNFAVRGTYAQGFRAPSPAENGKGGLAAFTTAADPVRCALGVPTACNPGSVAIITSPNAGLKPEKSESATLGMVWDVTPKTSFTADLWQIKRKNEINQEASSAAIAAGHVARDPSTATNVPGDPGGIVAILANYVNSSKSTVRGIDMDVRHRIDIPSNGRVTLAATWTHLMSFKRTDPDGTTYEFAGTHGNCDVTNCIGTPKDRISFTGTWETGQWRFAAVGNIRGPLADKEDKNGDCIDHEPIVTNCRVKSFMTVDVSALWKMNKSTEFYGLIRNVFDKKPPLDMTTYGATGYNPLDYSGAVGRYFSVGLRHRF